MRAPVLSIITVQCVSATEVLAMSQCRRDANVAATFSALHMSEQIARDACYSGHSAVIVLALALHLPLRPGFDTDWSSVLQFG